MSEPEIQDVTAMAQICAFAVCNVAIDGRDLNDMRNTVIALADIVLKSAAPIMMNVGDVDG